MTIKHPLALQTTVSAERSTCACKGGKRVTVTGKILKVITNHTGTWYYLDSGTTVKTDWVKSVLPNIA